MKSILIIFLLFYFLPANSQTLNSKVDKLNVGKLNLPKESLNKALILDGTGQVKSSPSVSDTELGYLDGLSDTIPNLLSGKEPSITSGTTSQYFRGDKTFQTLDKNAVGLGNVQNTDTTNPANITQSSTYRFVSDTEKSTWNSKEGAITPGTTSQYFRGDKTFQTLDKSAVGLSNVDNTSDVNKPISSATQTALNAKADDSVVVKLTGNQSISGTKTFTGKLVASTTINGAIPCPVMSQTQRDAFIAAQGDCVYNSTSLQLNVYDGSVWKSAGGSGGISLWLTGTAYAVNDVVIESDKIYRALTTHTSGTFATDLAALKWTEVSASPSTPYTLANGGTNKSLTAVNGGIVWVDSDSFEVLSAGISGQVLQSNGASSPSWVNKSIIGKAQNGSDVTVEKIQTPNNLLTSVGTNTFLSETGNHNLLINPSFEHSTVATGWTLSGCSSSAESTIVNHGLKSLHITCTAQTLKLYQDTTLYATYLNGQNSQRSVQVYSDVAGVSVCSGGATVASTTNCIAITQLNAFGLYEVPEPISASNGIYIVSSGAITGNIYVDDAKIDPSIAIVSNNSAKHFGSVTLGTDCFYSGNGGAYGNYTADASCTITASGSLLAPTTNIPAARIPAGSPAGSYFITANYASYCDAATAGVSQCFNQIFVNGVAASIEDVQGIQTANVDTSKAGTLTYRYEQTTVNAAAVDIELRYKVYAASPNSQLNNPSAISPIRWDVIYFGSGQTYSSQCGANCVDTFSAKISSTGVVSGENIDWINGNAVVSSTSLYTMTFNTGIFTVAPNCVSTTATYGDVWDSVQSVSTTGIGIYSVNSANGAVATNHMIVCQKQGADFVATRTIQGSFKEVMTTPNVSKPKTCYYGFGGAGATLAAPTECTTGTCVEVYDSCGTGTPPAWNSTALYTGITWASGTWANSTPISCSCSAYDTSTNTVRYCTPMFTTSNQSWSSSSSGGLILGTYSMNEAGTQLSAYIMMTCQGSAP